MENKNFSGKKGFIFLGKDEQAIIKIKELTDCERVQGPTNNQFQHYGELKDE